MSQLGLMTARRPWISDACWWDEFDAQAELPELPQIRREIASEAVNFSPSALLCLPYLETAIRKPIEWDWLEDLPLLPQLIDARARRNAPPDLLRSLRNHDLPGDVRAFLISWVRGEFDVLPPRPS